MAHLQNNRQTKGHIHKTVGREERTRERSKDGGMDEGGWDTRLNERSSNKEGRNADADISHNYIPIF